MRETREYTASGQLWNTRKEFIGVLGGGSRERDERRCRKIFEEGCGDGAGAGGGVPRASRARHSSGAGEALGRSEGVPRGARRQAEDRVVSSATGDHAQPDGSDHAKVHARDVRDPSLSEKSLAGSAPDGALGREGERYKIRLHELEDEAVARHATYQPAYVRLKEAELKKEIALLRRKFQQLRRMSFERHEKYAAQAACSSRSATWCTTRGCDTRTRWGCTRPCWRTFGRRGRSTSSPRYRRTCRRCNTSTRGRKSRPGGERSGWISPEGAGAYGRGRPHRTYGRRRRDPPVRTQAQGQARLVIVNV